VAPAEAVVTVVTMVTVPERATAPVTIVPVAATMRAAHGRDPENPDGNCETNHVSRPFTQPGCEARVSRPAALV
jgi:hypothetical protein